MYTYTYDYLDRLLSAETSGDVYRTAYDYDERGNITSLDRYDAQGTMIDALSYIPYSGTNQIKNVFDGGTAAGFDLNFGMMKTKGLLCKLEELPHSSSLHRRPMFFQQW